MINKGLLYFQSKSWTLNLQDKQFNAVIDVNDVQYLLDMMKTGRTFLFLLNKI